MRSQHYEPLYLSKTSPHIEVKKNNKMTSSLKFHALDTIKKQRIDIKPRATIKSLHIKKSFQTQSFSLLPLVIAQPRIRRKSDFEGIISQKIFKLDLLYPRTFVEQHSFLDRVKDLRRRAIKGRIKTKFQRSFKKLEIQKPSQFNPENSQLNEQMDIDYHTMQEIRIVRQFGKELTYFERFRKTNSDLMSESPATPLLLPKAERIKKEIQIKQKQHKFVLLDLLKFRIKPFQMLKNIQNETKEILNTKEILTNTPVQNLQNKIYHKFNPYFTKKNVLCKSNQNISISLRMRTIQ